MKCFFGMCTFYRRFVKDFAKRAQPLNAPTRAEVPPDLPPPPDAALAAFEDLRQALVNPFVLALPRAGRELVVDVDTCANELGYTLPQKEEDDVLHPIGH